MGQAQGRITNTGGPIAQTKPNAVEIRLTQAVAAMSQTYAALGQSQKYAQTGNDWHSSKTSKKPQKNPYLSSGSDFVISVYRKDFTKSEPLGQPPLKREVIIFFAFFYSQLDIALRISLSSVPLGLPLWASLFPFCGSFNPLGFRNIKLTHNI